MQRIKNLPYINNLLDNEVLYRNLNLNDEVIFIKIYLFV